MWSGLSTAYAVSSVYGFKDDASSLYDEEGKVSDEASLVQKDHRTLNRLKREVGDLKRKLKTILLI